MTTEQDESPAASRVHRIYGRGLVDGLRMAGIADPGGFMNEAKLQRVSEGLNGMERKVLEAVPIAEAWNRGQVMSELRRVGTNSAPDVVDSCLNCLKEKGLVYERERGLFSRKLVKPRLVLPEKPKEPATPAHTEEVRNVADPLERMGELAKELRDLAELLMKLAQQAESIALDSELRFEAARGEGEKLRQLQALLKSIGGA